MISFKKTGITQQISAKAFPQIQKSVFATIKKEYAPKTITVTVPEESLEPEVPMAEAPVPIRSIPASQPPAPSSFSSSINALNVLSGQKKQSGVVPFKLTGVLPGFTGTDSQKDVHQQTFKKGLKNKRSFLSSLIKKETKKIYGGG